MRNFMSEMYGNWQGETERERQLREQVEEYHAACDVFDRRVCTGVSPRSGEPMPVTPQESAAINKNAREVRSKLFYGFTDEEIHRAMRNYAKIGKF